MMAEEVEDPQSMLSAKLAQKAASKITELRKTIEMLLKAKDKDKRYFTLQKGKYQNEIRDLNQLIANLKLVIAEKDKIIQLQGIKMKEVLYAGEEHKINMLKQDFEVLSKLANPDQHKRGIPMAARPNMEKLEDLRYLEHKYGRNTTLKNSPGSRHLIANNYSRLDYLPVGKEEGPFARSRSVLHAAHK